MKTFITTVILVLTITFSLAEATTNSAPFIQFDREAIAHTAIVTAISNNPTLSATNLLVQSISYTWNTDLRRKYAPHFPTNRTEYIAVSLRVADTTRLVDHAVMRKHLQWQEIIVRFDIDGTPFDVLTWPAMFPIRPDIETNWMNEWPNNTSQGIGKESEEHIGGD